MGLRIKLPRHRLKISEKLSRKYTLFTDAQAQNRNSEHVVLRKLVKQPVIADLHHTQR